MLLFSFADDKITDYQYHCVIHYRGYNTKMQNKETGMSGMLLPVSYTHLTLPTRSTV